MRQPENGVGGVAKWGDVVFRLPIVGAITADRQPEKWVGALWLALGAVFAMRLVPTGHLLFFASPKKSKQKKGDPDVQVWLRQTSLTLHPFFGACELVALRAPSDKRTLFPEKRMLRSAGRRGEGSSIKHV